MADTLITAPDLLKISSTNDAVTDVIQFAAGTITRLSDNKNVLFDGDAEPPLGYVPEDAANKTSTIENTAESYPSGAAVSTALSLKLDAVQQSISTTVAGLKLVADPQADVIYQTTDNGGGAWFYNPVDSRNENTATIIEPLSGPGRFNRVFSGSVNIKWFGAKGDARNITDGVAISGSDIVSSASAQFSNDLVGTHIVVNGANSNGFPLSSTIVEVLSGTQVRMQDAALNTLSNLRVTYGGIDETSAFQDAVDYLIANNGGDLFIPTGRYWIDGTIYVSPEIQVPVSISGEAINPFQQAFVYTENAVTLMKVTAGDFFRVNLDASGKGVSPFSSPYTGFAISNIAFVGSAQISGVNGLKVFRTRGRYQNLQAGLMDYLIKQEDTDICSVENYCDASVYENLKVTASLAGGIRLYNGDSCTLSNFTMESILPNTMFGIEAIKCSPLVMKGLLYGAPSEELPDTFPSGSAWISLDQCFGASIEGAHIEDCWLETLIKVHNSGGVSVSNVYLYYTNGTTFDISTARGLNIKNIFSNDAKPTDYFDINFSGGGNVDVIWENYMAYIENTFTLRSLSIQNINDRGVIRSQVTRADAVTDFNSIRDNVLFSSGNSASPLPLGTSNISGLQLVIADNQNYINQLVFETAGGLYKRTLFNGAWRNYKVITTWTTILTPVSVITSGVESQWYNVDTSAGPVTSLLGSSNQTIEGIYLTFRNAGTNNFTLNLDPAVTVNGSHSAIVLLPGQVTSIYSLSINVWAMGYKTPGALNNSTVLVTDGAKNIVSSTTTSTELGYLSGVTAAIQPQLNKLPITGSFPPTTETAKTTFTITIGTTQADTSYKIQVMPTSAITAVNWYITNKTVTTFDVVFTTALTGLVQFDWALFK